MFSNVSNVHSSTFLLRWSKTIRHSDSISLDVDLCMDINEYESILSATIWFILLHLVLYKNVIKTLFEKFEECFHDALLSVKTFWKR